MESRVNNSHQVENSVLRPCLTQPGWENGIEKKYHTISITRI